MNVSAGTPSQSAHSAYSRDSETSVSPTSKNTARIGMPGATVEPPSARRPYSMA